MGSATPSVGERGTSLFVVTCGRVPGITPGSQQQACQEVRRINQPAGPQTEAALIHVMNCPGGHIYIYEYLSRPGFRVIRPPNWGQAIGGRDFPSMADAVSVARGEQPSQQSSQVVPPPPDGQAPRLTAPLSTGVGAGNTCPLPGYYVTQSVKGGPNVCLMCPTGTGNFVWYSDRKYCAVCPAGTHYEEHRNCIKN
jgi:hypothetical protein